jgi:peptidoglycan/LPS O-acetylase OafA/YrhL
MSKLPLETSKPRFDQLDGVRALASLWVVVEHATKGRDGYTGGNFAWLLAHGNAPVSYFIVLSGFVTSYANGAREFDAQRRFDFLVKRFARVALSYYAAMALTLVVGHGARPRVPDSPRAWVKLLLELIMASSLGGTTALMGWLNGFGWTISTLACCWLAYPRAHGWLRRADERALLALAAASIACSCALALLPGASVVREHDGRACIAEHSIPYL